MMLMRFKALAGRSTSAPLLTICLGTDTVRARAARMTYVYLIESVRSPARHYVGVTGDLKRRLRDHNRGASPHTAKFRPWHLVAYFAFAEEKTAVAFERYLKTGSGKAFLHKRLLRIATVIPPPRI